ncbi:glycosyltransferase, partial [uncultured Bifidobacterium sp.]|uniref:glycosyltransferase n=1 Tax=uncultured Bifidobacterium sp. TaxID=165187 RepID=UPI002597065E
MNVLNVLYDFWPGGVERLAIDVSNELERQGNNAYLCIISEHYSDNLLQQLDQRVQLIKLVKAAENRKFSYLRQLIRLIDNEKIQVVHVHQGSLMPF